MKLKKLEVFSKDEIELIHSSSIQLLEEIGIKVDSEKVKNLLIDKGAILNKENPDFVKIPEEIITDSLKLVPKSFKLYGPDGNFNFEVNLESTIFATIGTPVKIYDPESKKQVRKSLLKDTINQIRIVDKLKNIVCSHVDVWPNDIQYTAIHGHCIYQWAKNTRKPYGLGCYGRVASKDMMDLTSIIVGGEEELKKRPRLVGFFNPTSPLHLPKIMTNGFEIFANYNQPTIIAPEALAGSSAPVTLSGLLTQTNAEILASIVLSQSFNPGAPIFYGTVSHVMDMLSGNSALGTAETGLITAGIAQLGRYYRIPSRGPGAVTDSKCFDIQNGIERYQTLLLAAQAGINYITCAGTYEATLVESLELLVIDDELVELITRVLEGIVVDEDSIGLDIIKKVATSQTPGMTFLSEKHTRKYMKRDLFMPIHKLFDRHRRTTWKKLGGKDILEIAREKVAQMLNNHKEYELSPAVEIELLTCIKEIEKRDLNYYMEKEGIKIRKTSLPGLNLDV